LRFLGRAVENNRGGSGGTPPGERKKQKRGFPKVVGPLSVHAAP